MDHEILSKILQDVPLTTEDKEQILADICEDVHSTCVCGCPIFEIFGQTPQEEYFVRGKKRTGCPYHKDGAKMLQCINEKGL